MLNSRDPTSWKGAGFPSDQRTQSAMVYYRIAERAKRRIRRGTRKVYLWYTNGGEKLYFYKVHRSVVKRLWSTVGDKVPPELVFGYTHRSGLDRIQRMLADGSIVKCRDEEVAAYTHAAVAERDIRRDCETQRRRARRKLFAYTEMALDGPFIDTTHETIARAYLTAHRMLRAFAHSSGLELTGGDGIDERLALQRNLNIITNRYFQGGHLTRWVEFAASSGGQNYEFCGSRQSSALLAVYLGSALFVSKTSSAYHQAIAGTNKSCVESLWHKDWLRFLANTALPDRRDTQALHSALRHEYKRVMLQVFPDFIPRLREAEEAWLRAKQRFPGSVPNAGHEENSTKDGKKVREPSEIDFVVYRTHETLGWTQGAIADEVRKRRKIPYPQPQVSRAIQRVKGGLQWERPAAERGFSDDYREYRHSRNGQAH